MGVPFPVCERGRLTNRGAKGEDLWLLGAKALAEEIKDGISFSQIYPLCVALSNPVSEFY